MRTRSTLDRVLRGGLAFIAMLTLVVAVATGLARLGWQFGQPPATASHGPIFVLGFLGIVIGMERAVALRRRWAWLIPATCGGAVLALVAGSPARNAGLLLAAAGLGLIAVFVAAHRIQPELHIRIMGIGAVLYLISALALLMKSAVPQVVPAMAGFLILTIVGERLELSRLIRTSSESPTWLMAAVVLVIAGALVSLAELRIGTRISGLGLLGCAGWLAVNDVARRTLRMPGVTRYMAAALLLGYLWLAVAGVIWSGGGLDPGRVSYDAGLHAFFLGFVFSMVFAHAPVIAPALFGISLPYTPRLWAPLLLLHLSLSLRVVGGLGGSVEARMWGGLLNAGAMAMFAAVAGSSVWRGHRRRRVNVDSPRRVWARSRGG